VSRLKIYSFLIFICFHNFASAQRAFDNFEEASRGRTIADLVAACRHGYNQSNICDLIMELQQLGADAVETVKALIPLGPLEYFLLTVLNYSSTGRLRTQLEPLIHPDVKNTIEFQNPDQFWILFSYQF
jgi:hypothetical protein